MNSSRALNSDTLLSSRKLFLEFNDFRINRTLYSFPEPSRLAFVVIPRLLHVNQPGLPGYIGPNVPCGIYNLGLDQSAQRILEQVFPDTILRRDENTEPFIHSLFLIGSIGTIAQSDKSDMDFTLLVEKKRFSEKSYQLFQKKLRAIEQWTWDQFQLETHFFVNDIEDVKNNNFGESDSENTGSAQAKLLKEEMYRTMIVVAGKIPFWWVVPLKTDDASYTQLHKNMTDGNTLLKHEEFVDIGNVDDIAPGEFFGGSIWILIKSFQGPFKTLMKMGLLEEYIHGNTKFNLLCHEIKKKLHGGTPFTDIDPYLALFERVHNFFIKTKGSNEIDALRTSFYLKGATRIHPNDNQTTSKDPYKTRLMEMINAWEWYTETLDHLNQYDQWHVMEKATLGNRVHKVIINSYKSISEKNKTLDSKENFISKKDTHLLGRKLFSLFRKSPSKVENIFSLVDGDIAEQGLTFLQAHSEDRKMAKWQLIRGKTHSLANQISRDKIIKTSSSLPFLVAFTALNKLYGKKTELLLRGEGISIKTFDLNAILKQLSESFSQVNISAISNQDLLSCERATKLYLVIDFGCPPPRKIFQNNIQDCKNREELNEFIHSRLDKIVQFTVIQLSSWGELFCQTYSGTKLMDRFLSDIGPQIDPIYLNRPDFLSIYIPSGKESVLQIPWLKNYLTHSFKVIVDDSPHSNLESHAEFAIK